MFRGGEGGQAGAMTAALLTSTLAALPLAGEAPPDWVQLLPAPADGAIRTHDGRGPYRVADAAALVAASMGRRSKLVIDENHATDLAAPKGGPAPARGRIVAMEARADGVWGRVEWTSSGRALLADGAYDGLSPVIEHDKHGTIRRILRAALVNEPNLRGLAALHQEQDSMDFKAALAELLGLPASASEDDLLGAVRANAAPPDAALQSALAEIGAALGVEGAEAPAILAAARAAKAGPGEVVAALQSELATLTARLNEVTAAVAREKAVGFVDGEIRRGNPAAVRLRDHYIARHMAEPAKVEMELRAMPGLAGTLLDGLPPAGAADGAALDAGQIEIARRLGLEPAMMLQTLHAEQGKAAP
jgi:phage I-like protein